MSTHTASIAWTRKDTAFTDGKYPRAHIVRFDGGETLTGSPAPDVVRPPLYDPNGTDPEEMLVAAVASCHMMFFLDFARKAGFRIDAYEDAAEGTLGRDEAGVARFTEVRLAPKIMWSGEVLPSAADIALLHHKAHDACYIGQSLKCPVVVL